MTEQNKRTKWLHVRLTPKEAEQLQKGFKKTTTRKLSDYARNILLGKPMIAGYKNQSLNDIAAELFRLRKDLNGIANNFNQAVHKLHTLEHIHEFKAWVTTYEAEKRKLLRDLDGIKNYIDKTADKWLQS